MEIIDRFHHGLRILRTVFMASRRLLISWSVNLLWSQIV
jgi:hypothetical protein